MTQKEQPEQQKDYIGEAMEQLTPEEVNQCFNGLLQSNPDIATKFDNMRFQMVIHKQAVELEQLKNGNSNGVVQDAETIVESVS